MSFSEDVEAGAIGQDCGKFSSVGSRCIKPSGHTDPHL